VPTRDAENQLRVVPAWESKFEWQGWFSPMPAATIDSFAVMANARELAEPLGSEFAAPHRSNRIRQLVSSRTDWTAAEMPQIHSDTQLLSAPLMLDLLTDLEDLSPRAADLRASLAAWDQCMDADSTTASTYAAYRKALIHRLADHPTLAVLEDDIDVPEVFVPWMDPLAHVGFALENLITTDLLPDVNIRWLAREALEEVAHSKPRKPWGETHQLSPLHAIRGPLFTSAEEPIDLALSGDHHCVWSTSSLPGLTDVCIRASAARYAWDLADRTNSAWSVPLGASGVLGDPHHHNQLPHWLTAQLIPITTNWAELTKES
jgi:penicillin amidase